MHGCSLRRTSHDLPLPATLILQLSKCAAQVQDFKEGTEKPADASTLNRFAEEAVQRRFQLAQRA